MRIQGRHPLSTILILLSSTASYAAPHAATAATDVILRSPWIGSGCPISISVRRTSPTVLLNAEDAARHLRSQRIHLSVDPLDTSGIRSAALTVHAASLDARFLPANASDSSPEVDRTFQISGSSASGMREKDLWIDGVSSVISVDLTAITYLDGSTWRRSPKAVCRAVPSNLLPISSR